MILRLHAELWLATALLHGLQVTTDYLLSAIQPTLHDANLVHVFKALFLPKLFHAQLSVACSTKK